MINLKITSDNYSAPTLQWDRLNEEDYLYSIYRRVISHTTGENVTNDEFRPIPLFNIYSEDYNDENISVLNLHEGSSNTIDYQDWLGDQRTISESASLEKWVYESNNESNLGYGLARMTIHSMSYSDFEQDALNILYSSDDKPKYDVICIGVGSYGCPTFSEYTVKAIEKHILNGLGVIVSGNVLNGEVGSLEGIGLLRKYFNVKLGENGPLDSTVEIPDYHFGASFAGSKIILHKKNTIMSYPWMIGSQGDLLDVVHTSTTSQFANGDIWLTFDDPNITGITNLNSSLMQQGNHYLTTNNNCALIQANNGHYTLDIEKKIIVNTIFAMKQNTRKTNYTDVTRFDNAKPSKPKIINNYIDLEKSQIAISYRSDDIGVVCEYYVKAYNIERATSTKSNIVSCKYISGIQNFLYKFIPISENADQIEWVETTDTSLFFNDTEPGNYKLIIKCIDQNGNESDTTEYLVFMPDNSLLEKTKNLHHPNMHRLNHRYRGPHESYKALGVVNQAKKNITDLQKIYDDLNIASQNSTNINIVDNHDIYIIKRYIEQLLQEIKGKKYLNKCNQS